MTGVQTCALPIYSAEGATDFWVHANVVRVSAGADCPGGRASYSVSLDGIRPPGGLALVEEGAPARGAEPLQLTGYTDTYGDGWVGIRQFNKGNGWGGIQPVVGPVMSGGLRFAYLDEAGVPTTDPAHVASVALTVVGRSTTRVKTSTGMIDHLRDSVVTTVAFRGREE